jgi:hypothetical protein
LTSRPPHGQLLHSFLIGLQVAFSPLAVNPVLLSASRGPHFECPYLSVLGSSVPQPIGEQWNSAHLIDTYLVESSHPLGIQSSLSPLTTFGFMHYAQFKHYFYGPVVPPEPPPPPEAAHGLKRA